MQSYESVRDRLKKALTAMTRDLPETRPACISLHRDLDLERTPLDDETKERIKDVMREQTGREPADPDPEREDADIDMSKEHMLLHRDLSGITTSFMLSGRVNGPTDLVALAIQLGRRYGRIEAATFLDVNDLDVLPE